MAQASHCLKLIKLADMIRSIYRDALGTIRNAEQKISFEPAAIIEESYHMTTVLRGLLSQMKSHVLEKGFADDNEEIEFFKTIKPQILGKLIYYNKVFRIEASCPVGGGTLYHKYFTGELHQLKQEYKEHICNTDFYRYYRLGRTDWDHHFFQLGKIDLHSGVNSFVFEIDTQFSTYYDYKVARIIANELLYNYLLSRISPEEPEGLFFPEENGKAKDILWTDSKSALIELIYALHASGSISNGKVGIRRISAAFQNLFRIQLGDVHHAFHRMKDRSESRSIYLDQLKASLAQHMDRDL